MIQGENLESVGKTLLRQPQLQYKIDMTFTESVLEDEGMYKKIFLKISILMTCIGIFLNLNRV